MPPRSPPLSPPTQSYCMWFPLPPTESTAASAVVLATLHFNNNFCAGFSCQTLSFTRTGGVTYKPSIYQPETGLYYEFNKCLLDKGMNKEINK